MTDAKQYNRKQMEEGKLLPEWVDLLVEMGAKQFQTEQQLDVDGKVGPQTQERLKLLSEPVAPVRPSVGSGLGYFPTGKGVYIRTLKHCGTPEQAVATAKEAGLNFVVIGSIWISRRVWAAGAVVGRRFNKTADLERYSKAFRDAGIEVWVWGYPYPGRERQFVDQMIADALTTGAVGLILDPEKPYRKKHAQADMLMQMLRPEIERLGLALGVTSYGSIWYFKNFPWREFAQIPGTFASPQIYDNDNNFPASHSHKSFRMYQEAGFGEIVMSAPGYNKTTEQWIRLVNRYPAGTRGIIVWDWSNLRLRKWRHLWKAIRDYQV